MGLFGFGRAPQVSGVPEVSEGIRNPEGLSLVDLPKAVEIYEEDGAHLLIRPTGMGPEVSPIVGARVAEKDTVSWTRETFFAEAGIDPSRVVRIQQKHTASVRPITADMAGAGALDQPGEDTRIKTADGQGMDAAWTKEKDLTLMLGTADCTAVLVSGKDKDGQEIVGVAHAGIAGAQGDVVGNLIRSMVSEGQADASTLAVYAGPSVCERCFESLSDDPEHAGTDKMPMEEMVKINEDGIDVSIPITKLTAAMLRFKEKYGEAFEKTNGRELQENDLYYIRRNADGQHNELLVNINMFVYLSLIGNGVGADKIGFSAVCSAHDGLPSYQRTKETTGVLSTIKIN